jgi:pyruvate dehydrogenase E2 component (dihydrolipoamide acetyltransferase)
VKITPGHDFNDYEMGKRHSLPVINIFDDDARLNENVPPVYIGMDRFDARKEIISNLDSLGLLKKIDAHKIKIPRGDRSGVIIEPYLTDQWYVKASPLAKRLAKESGYNLSEIKGSGPNGRVVKSDVESYTPSAAPVASAAATVGVESFEDVPATNMRKAITKSLSASQFGAPHFYLTMDIDMDKAIEARKSLNEISPVKISFNDLVVKAVATALRAHPDVNSSWISESNAIRTYSHINIGVAMAIPDGLVVPVVRFADAKSLSVISSEVKELAGKAKSKKLGLDEMQGNTFTISNLGMFGIEEFTSIINAPESCILAVGGIKQVPVVKDGAIVPGNVMKVTLTCDHRTVDGAVGAAFLATLKQLLEDPIRILV